MKNNILAISIFIFSLVLLIVGLSYLNTYKLKDNYNSIRVDTTFVEENIKPTHFLATFNLSFGKLNVATGATFEQTNGVNLEAERIRAKLTRFGMKGAIVTTEAPYMLSTSTDYLSGYRIFIPITNDISESVIGDALTEFRPESFLITKNIDERSYLELGAKLDNKNLDKNRKEADQKAKTLRTKILGVQNNINPDYQMYPLANNIISESGDGNLKMTNYATVNYIIGN